MLKTSLLSIENSYSSLKQDNLGHKIQLEIKSAVNFFILLKELEFKFRLIDICAIDNLRRNIKSSENSDQKRFTCVYHFLCLENFERVFVYLNIDCDDFIPNLKNLWSFSGILQEEVYDLFGIKTIDQRISDVERIFTHGNILGYPMRKDFSIDDSRKNLVLNQTKEEDRIDLEMLAPVQLVKPEITFKVDEGIIQETFIKIGNRHLGVEKIFEKTSYTQSAHLALKLNSLGSVNHGLLFVKTIEDFLKMTIPEKSQAIRMIFSELSRIGDHLHCLGMWAYELSAVDIYHDCLGGRELILKLHEKFCGSRINPAIFCIGGLTRDIPAEWHLSCLEVIGLLNKVVVDLGNFLGGSRTWQDRNEVGKINGKQALEFGHTGPILRAAGINFDIRKRFPYYFYNEVDFEIPLGADGSALDRYAVRIEEIRQSIGIIVQLIDGLPTGDYVLRDNPFVMGTPDLLLNDRNMLSKHISDIQTGASLPRGEYYSCIESSSGELGAYLVSEGGIHPYRLHMIPPNIGFLNSYKLMTENLPLEDAALVYCSMNILSSEVER